MRLSLRPVWVLLPAATLAAGLAFVGSAEAVTSTPVADLPVSADLKEASVDGRWLLFTAQDAAEDDAPRASRGQLLDTRTGSIRAVDADDVTTRFHALASRSPRVLSDRSNQELQATELVLTDFSTKPATSAVVSIGPDGSPLPISERGTSALVRDGHAVVFQSGDAIYLRDLDAKRTTKVQEGVELADASEDGRVITWFRELPRVKAPTDPSRPAGLPNEHLPEGLRTTYGVFTLGEPVLPRAAGYTVIGEEPHVLAVDRYEELSTVGNCSVGDSPASGIDATAEVPVELQVSVSRSGKYQFLLRTETYEWEGRALTYAYKSAIYQVANGARVVTETSAGYPMRTGINSVGVVAYPGVISAGGTAWSTPTRSVTSSSPAPFADGQSAYALFDDRLGDLGYAPLVRYDEPSSAINPTVGTDLPRFPDPVANSAVQSQVSWAKCARGQAAGKLRDYVALTPPRSGNPGQIQFATNPEFYRPAKRMIAAYTWAGLVIWHGLVDKSGEYALPGVPNWLPGATGYVFVWLDDDTLLSASRGLN